MNEYRVTLRNDRRKLTLIVFATSADRAAESAALAEDVPLSAIISVVPA